MPCARGLRVQRDAKPATDPGRGSPWLCAGPALRSPAPALGYCSPVSHPQPALPALCAWLALLRLAPWAQPLALVCHATVIDGRFPAPSHVRNLIEQPTFPGTFYESVCPLAMHEANCRRCWPYAVLVVIVQLAVPLRTASVQCMCAMSSLVVLGATLAVMYMLMRAVEPPPPA